MSASGTAAAKEEIAGVGKKRGCGVRINLALFFLLAIWLIANALYQRPASVTVTTPTTAPLRVTGAPTPTRARTATPLPKPPMISALEREAPHLVGWQPAIGKTE